MRMHPKGKLIGLAILIAGIASLITSAPLDPIMARVGADLAHTRLFQLPQQEEPEAES